MVQRYRGHDEGQKQGAENESQDEVDGDESWVEFVGHDLATEPPLKGDKENAPYGGPEDGGSLAMHLPGKETDAEDEEADGDTGQPVGVLDPGECEVEGRRVDVGRKLADVGGWHPAVETARPVRTPEASAGGPYETADRHQKEGRCGGCDCSPLKTSYVETGHTDQATGERPRRQ